MSEENHGHEPEDDISQMMYIIAGVLLASMVLAYLVAF